jgi:hypothetical protein
MSPEEYAEMRRRRDEQQARMKRMMEECLADGGELADRIASHPLPWSWAVTFHDGLFYQFFDANGRPCLGNDLRDPEDAAFLLTLINSMQTAR